MFYFGIRTEIAEYQLWDFKTKNGKGDVTYGTDGDGKLVSSRNRIQCYVETF